MIMKMRKWMMVLPLIRSVNDIARSFIPNFRLILILTVGASRSLSAMSNLGLLFRLPFSKRSHDSDLLRLIRPFATVGAGSPPPPFFFFFFFFFEQSRFLILSNACATQTSLHHAVFRLITKI